MLSIDAVEDLEVGDVGFYVIAGRVGGVVSAGQALIDFVNLCRGKHSENAWFTHAFIVTEIGSDEIGGYADVIEAMPRGARMVRLRGQDRIGRGYGYARLALTPTAKQALSVFAPVYVGTPYGFSDYLSIALLHTGFPRKLIAGYVQKSGRMICSQLVDVLLCRVGFHLFTDGRLSQDVTPGALFNRAGAVGQIMWW